MKNVFPHIIENIEDWPITQFSDRREEFIISLRKYTMEKILKHKKYDLSELLQKSIFFEKKRIKGEAWKVDPSDEAKFWNKMEAEVNTVNAQLSSTTADYLPILEKMIHRYAEEVVGHFKPKTFKFARRFLTAFFKRIYNKARFSRPGRLYGSKEELLGRLPIQGPVEKVRKLFDKGVVVAVPTHFSNLDSILIGYQIDMQIGVPAFIYGAGLNLYNTEIIAYFMNRLGTYRVDRRKKNLIYIETLKSMNTLTIIQGVNNLFFPGGTRSRSGSIEKSLKLGLLNSTVEAQRYCIDNGIDRKVFIVPIVTRYPFVLDAQGLITEELARKGQERYFHSQQPISILGLLRLFVSRIFNREGKSYMSFGEPMDVFGNLVDDEGTSRNKAGQAIDIQEYFTGIESEANYIQRESIYTKNLGEKIIEQYNKANIIIPSHLVAFLAYKFIEYQQSDTDIFNLLLLDVKNLLIPREIIVKQIAEIQKHLLAANVEGKIRISDEMKATPKEILTEGMHYLGIYNKAKTLTKVNKDTIGTESLKLLYYYHNQLSSDFISELYKSKEIQVALLAYEK